VVGGFDFDFSLDHGADDLLGRLSGGWNGNSQRRREEKKRAEETTEPGKLLLL
jgi:hypothetical protein